MTNPIPPCPVCGTVPKCDTEVIVIARECYERIFNTKVMFTGDTVDVYAYLYRQKVNEHLGRACRELGIETVEQLKSRLAPDPRVAVLEAEIDRLVEVNRRLVNERTVLLDVKTTDGLTASEWVMRTAIAESKLKLIAAQRGEVEK